MLFNKKLIAVAVLLLAVVKSGHWAYTKQYLAQAAEDAGSCFPISWEIKIRAARDQIQAANTELQPVKLKLASTELKLEQLEGHKLNTQRELSKYQTALKIQNESRDSTAENLTNKLVTKIEQLKLALQKLDIQIECQKQIGIAYERTYTERKRAIDQLITDGDVAESERAKLEAFESQIAASGALGEARSMMKKLENEVALKKKLIEQEVTILEIDEPKLTLQERIDAAIK